MTDAPNILYEDNHLLIALKPTNMPVQADESGDDDLLTILRNYLIERYSKPGAAYLGLVHRMDRPVGGVVAFAKTSKAAARLSEQLRAHSMRRIYRAVARGRIDGAGTLRDYLYKDTRSNTVSVVDANAPGARAAVLRYEPLRFTDYIEPLSLVEIELETGRSHQIRVQLAHAGYPLWGDARYGAGKPGQQIALWGYELILTHPTRKEEMRFSAPMPNRDPWTRFNDYA
ncbi:MAG: RluA family pseudouridine synthase [Oscillospiraceae bacterium]|jgi:23S rRNA pseudouridine1911/1915/1917 synthase|nr:RluA family pseudouridine synthase [Oscillospiraceae bacterium]